ncbi:MAG: hypothetical protein JEZ12_25605 [Desulfobacterium sp.]|nr:hypothetical protein [Desulfobacterium sp.]
MLERKQIQRLLDIAFLGFQKGHTAQARQVIDGLDQLLEESVELEICRAMGFYTVDQFEAATEILSAAEEKYPENPMVKTHTALVDLLLGNTFEAKNKLDHVIEGDLDPQATALAKQLMAAYC